MRAGLLAALAVTLAGCAPSVSFADREILWHWPDDQPIPMPKPRDQLHFMWQDVRDGLFQPPDRVLALDYLREARNVNALDELPDSAWFVDRRRVPGRAQPRSLSPDELFWGALGRDEAPELPLTVVKGKELGSTPGFVALDARRRKYMIKLDPPNHLGMTSSTEVVVTRLAWASGWRVPAESLVEASPDQIRLDPHATLKDDYGNALPYTAEMLGQLLARAPRLPDGKLRLLASAWLPGTAIGSYAYLGRRKDDPNDTIDHEARRDLRGLGVFASWVNDIDTFETNTLDMYEGAPGRGHVVHYQQDLGGSFGNWTGVPAPFWTGSETFLEPHLIVRSFFTLGLWPRPFHDWHYQQYKERLPHDWPDVGAFEASRFDPRTWQPMLENPAFARQTARDHYWGAKRVAAFSDGDLRTVVAAGRYRPAAAERVVAILARRRDQIARAFFGDLAPLDYFRLDGDRLCFDDLWLAAGLGGGGEYRARTPQPSAVSLVGRDRCVTLPPGQGYRVVALQVRRAGERGFGRPVRVHLMVRGASRRILGVER